ncbi:cytoplasmic protein [Cryptococcus deuterogattii 99/473]|uniref:Unplaced genomic scaffold supercont1.10, whole genome shotgun sequence n=1 Tax=Cryptococcus deuterogattii Ram5 TaxID=1296110 RepID=A0A0D0V4L5_9TREE|nr:cytoplasmic protein [Cryptococcus deuterogattii Ram5]KIY55195.1 cytoplasmic protein [Cryptococcus deuterogattii 99/473]
MNTHSPPLLNLQSLSISPSTAGYQNPNTNNNYRYNTMFGAPAGMAAAPQPAASPDWSSGDKRSSRSGLPNNWYDPNEYRRDVPSPPSTLSPPSSIPTTASSNPHQSYPYQPQPSYPESGFSMPIGIVDTPSPPPMGYAPIGFSGAYTIPRQHPQISNPADGWRNGYAMPAIPTQDDDVIPTAIVIKNIPFAVSRETLLGVMESLGAPLPYAFNYHHDNGVFRGLAFANFRAPDEAASVVAALNGVLVFKEDRMRDELAFSKNLSPTERRIVHLVAQKLGLTSVTRGEEEQCVVVTREPQRPALLSTTSLTSPTYLSPYGSQQNSTSPISGGPNGGHSGVPGDSSPNLRYKKSMPDLRGFNGPSVARDPAKSLNPQRSSGNIREMGREYASMGTVGGRKLNGHASAATLNVNTNGQSHVYGSGNGREQGYGGFSGLFGNSVNDIPPVPPLPTGLGMHSKMYSVSSVNGVNGIGHGHTHSHSHSYSQTHSHAQNGRVSPEDLLSPTSATNFSGQQQIPSPQHRPSQPQQPQAQPSSQNSSQSQSQSQGHGQSQVQSQPLRNPRGPAGESRGFGSTQSSLNNMSGLGGLKSVASRSMIGGAGSGSATGPGSVIGGAPVSSSTSPGSANVGTAGYEKDTEESMRTREGLDI